MNATLTRQLVTISGEQLTDLLTGALVASEKGKDARTRTAGVYLSATGNTFKVLGTDTFRLVVGTSRNIREINEADPGELFEAFIPNEQVKAILANIKRVPIVVIIREGLSLTVRGTSEITFSLLDQVAPPVIDILAKVSGEPVGLPSVCLNPDLLAGLAKIPTTGNGMRLSFFGDKLPIKIDIKHDLITWDVLLMPMRDIK